jgi:hypothetical protein
MSYVKLMQSYLFINPNELIGVDDEYCAQQNKTCGINLDTLRAIVRETFYVNSAIL